MSAVSSNLLVLPAEAGEVLAACGVGEPCRRKDDRVRYLEGYLASAHAVTAIVEKNYIDRDFLEDYARYYSRCFSGYPRVCCRIHFFKGKYSDDQVNEMLLGANPDLLIQFQKDYLGFIVIRPLPETIIGRTCLIPYADGVDNRYYRSLCTIGASLCGQPLHVKCMPFQEQDSAVAACATCSLWAAFHVAADLFKSIVLSPAKITELATRHGLSEVRCMPNKLGLSHLDMLYAVRNNGLDPVCVDVRETFAPLRNSVIKGNAYGYLAMGVPVILLVDCRGEKGVSIGQHAVTICGYHLRSPANGDWTSADSLFANQIDKLYVNDDQIGPYARIDVSGENWYATWEDSSGSREEEGIVPLMLIIPVYHKLRVTYEEVWEKANQVNSAIEGVGDAGGRLPITWQISLSKNEDFMAQIREDQQLDRVQKLAYLKGGFPKYIWQIGVFLSDERIALFVVDATDAGQGFRIISTIVTDGFAKLISKLIEIHPEVQENPICRAALADAA